MLTPQPTANAVLVNVGDFLDRFTNGDLPSTPHRVVTRSNASSNETTRYSCVLFVQPDWHAAIADNDATQCGDLMPIF